MFRKMFGAAAVAAAVSASSLFGGVGTASAEDSYFIFGNCYQSQAHDSKYRLGVVGASTRPAGAAVFHVDVTYWWELRNPDGTYRQIGDNMKNDLYYASFDNSTVCKGIDPNFPWPVGRFTPR